MQSDNDGDNQSPTDSGNPLPGDPSMPEDTLVGKEPVGPFPIIVLLVWMVALSIATIYALMVCLFPQVDSARNVWSVNLFGMKSAFPQNVQPLALSLLAGALGGQAYAMKSFCWYVGNRTLHWSWIPRYLLSPILGSGMAFMFHFIVTSGLQGGQANAANANPQVTVGIGILVGLFYEQAMEKLHQVATAFFADTPVGRDRIAHQAPGKIVPVIVKPDPNAPKPGPAATDPILDLSQHRPLKRPYRPMPQDVSGGIVGEHEPAQEQNSTITAVVKTSTEAIAIETTAVNSGMSDPDAR